MAYTPNYVPGRIVVKFIEVDTSKHGDFYRKFGKTLGYEYVGRTFNDLALFEVPIGKEKRAMKIFMEYTKFVDWSDKYDQKFDSRCKAIEKLEGLVTDLDDAAESDGEFKSSLDKIITYAKVIKKSK